MKNWFRFPTILPSSLLVIAFLTVTRSQGADPQLGNLVPQGGQRGTELVVHFHGARIGQDPLEIVSYEAGIEVTEIKSVDANHGQAKFKIAESCRLGIHPLRVRTATGLTRVRTFHVGALPEIAEKEPNSDFSTPQSIPMNSTVRGLVETEDVDYYEVEAKQGQRISAELEGIRLGRTFFDPYLAILNPERFELATSDDSALLAQDPVVSLLAPKDGKYIIQVRESAFGGSNACTYRLHIGHFPRPLALLPAGGRPGETLEVQWLGDVAGPQNQSLVVPTDPREKFGLHRQDDQGISPSPNVFRIGNLVNFLESEPNNDSKTATACLIPDAPGGMAFNGVINQPGDYDHFQFKAKKGQVLDVHVFARRLRSPLDPVVHIRQANQKYVAGNDDSGGKPDSYLRFTAPEEGEYIVQIHDHLLAGGPHYTYRIEISPPAPKIELQIAERQRWVATKLEVPVGNRTAFIVNAARRDFGGPLQLHLENLQEGVTFETVPMQANRSMVPIVLSASANATKSTSLPEVKATPVEESKHAHSSFSQRTWLVKGRNNVEVWSHYADRAAVAVTDAVPFTLAMVEPKVPLVRNGSMQLKVVATRSQGFDAPISVRMLYNPPGVSSSRSISIAKEKNEALIPITANGGAAIQEWDICIEGQTNINGRVLVSTPLGKLEVHAPYVAMTFPKVNVELNHEVAYPIGVKVNTPFEGKALVTLQGMPAGVTSTPLEMTAETKELNFLIKTTNKSPPGMHKSLSCRFSIVENGEPIGHTVGSGQLRIDKPLPPKKEKDPKK